MALACIGIGSNLGDRSGHIRHAWERLQRLPGTTLTAFSKLYETEPIGPVEQGAFLNAAAALQTDLEPLDLLHELRRIEQSAGRQREQRWGPRTLDLDLLLYDERTRDDEELTLPHPRMHERWFVLKPLCDVAPDARHPALNQTVRELLAALET